MRGLLASPLGFLIGVSLGALGGGGSILAVPALVYGAGQDVRAATTTSLLVVGLASLVGMVGHWRAGRVRVGAGIVFGVTGIGGSIAGSALNARLDPDVLLLAFSGLIVVAAWRMLTACPSCTQAGESRALAEPGSPEPDPDSAGPAASGGTATTAATVAVDVVTIVVAGTAVGFLTGLFGVGGGFVIVPALTLALGFSMPNAIGTSLLVIAINAAAALAARGGPAEVEWSVALPFLVAALAGVLTGKRIADRLPAETMLRGFAGLLVGVAVFTAASSIFALV
ncbi:MAG TPA: sulfite exporter TauE/SafE family protein [Acidimicrobiia bacterium]